MTEREKTVVEIAIRWARNSSTSNGVWWAAKMLEDLVDRKENPDCPVCEGSKVFRECPCSHCGATGTIDGLIKTKGS